MELRAVVEFYLVETTFIFGINLLVAVPTPCVQFGLQATRPLKDYARNTKLPVGMPNLY